MPAAALDRCFSGSALALSLALVGAFALPLPAAEISLAQAIQATLADQPGVQIQWETVRAAEGGLQAVQGQFDPTIVGGVNLDRRDTPVPPYAAPASPQESRENSATLAVSKAFRNGVVVTPQLNLIDVSNANTRGQPVATSEIAVAVTVPLLRGAGRESAAANEQAADLALRAQREAARFGVENRVFVTVNAYWSAVGARQTEALLEDTLGRGRDFLQTLETLRSAGLIERASAEQAAAQLADYERQVASARAATRVARLNLGGALGLAPERLLTDAPAPVDGLPEVGNPTDDLLGARLAAAALRDRGDHRAVLLAVERAQVLLAKAERDARPQLDLTGRVGFAGGAADASRVSRLGGALTEHVEGPNAGIGLSLAWPVRNNFFAGVLRQQRAAARTAELNADLSAQTVTVAVMSVWELLRSAALEHRLANEAADRLLYAAGRERERASNGEASVSDVIDLEQRLLSARLATIATRQNYAAALVQLRLLAGMLSVPGEEEQATFDLAQLTQLPDLVP